MQDTVTFPVDVKGIDTEREYKGVFTAKVKLSMRESLREDENRRDLLGKRPESASQWANEVAAALAYLSVRITNSPEFWKDCNNGIDLEDSNVLVTVNNACMEEISKLYEEQGDDAEKSRKKLKQDKADEEKA